MLKEIKKRLDDYLEFDSDDLFNLQIKKPLVRIFGGAIRDSISKLPINDIDILSGSKSANLLESVLEKNGYTYMESLTPKDLSSVYKDIHIINEPHTWLKGSKIVQIIRPAGQMSYKTYEESFINLIQNVDISCCGVSYDGEILYENFKDAINHCKFRYYKVNGSAKMYNENRTFMRQMKLTDRGWKELKGLDNERNFKLESLFKEQNDKFESEYMKEVKSFNLDSYL